MSNQPTIDLLKAMEPAPTVVEFGEEAVRPRSI